MKNLEVFLHLVGEPMVKAVSATIGVVAVLIVAKIIPVVENK